MGCLLDGLFCFWLLAVCGCFNCLVILLVWIIWGFVVVRLVLFNDGWVCLFVAFWCLV